jgi:hypothetical protein
MGDTAGGAPMHEGQHMQNAKLRQKRNSQPEERLLA